jgi:hypothetical protein
MFDPSSRYYKIEDAEMNVTGADGTERTIVYKRRRFISHGNDLPVLLEHVFAQSDRLDNITAMYIGDPTQFWRICDANNVMHPGELENVGRIIRISLPYV